MIDYSLTDSVAEIVLNDPAKLNALDEAALAALSTTFALAADEGARAVILRGEGRAFCAGRDISHVDPATDDAFGYLDTVVAPVLRQIAEFPAPPSRWRPAPAWGSGWGCWWHPMSSMSPTRRGSARRSPTSAPPSTRAARPVLRAAGRPSRARPDLHR
jgi:Enoyl-CoA hydratase (EC 4.2.1.17)